MILVVEDNVPVAMLMEDMFKDEGFDVLVANTAKQALATLEQHPEVRLLFTDYIIPGMKGDELASRAVEMIPELSVIIATGFTGLAMTADYMVMDKPVDMRDVKTAMKRLNIC